MNRNVISISRRIKSYGVQKGPDPKHDLFPREAARSAEFVQSVFAQDSSVCNLLCHQHILDMEENFTAT